VGAAGQIVLHDLKSGSSETVLFLPTNGFSMDVLGDGRLLFETASSRENLREFVVGGGEAVRSRWLTRGQSTDRQPVYSPDGQWVLFSSNRSGNLDLWEISTTNGVVRRLTNDAAEDWDPGFTPDGKHILWSSNRSGPFEIWTAEADGGNPSQLSHDGVDAENPTTGGDARWIYYNSGHPGQIGIWKVGTDGARATQVVRGYLSVPDVSPDGRFVAFASSQNGLVKVARTEDGVVVFSAVPSSIDVSATRQQGVLGRARWMNRGAVIAFVGRDENGVNGVYVQDFVPGVDTQQTRRRLGGFDPDSITESLAISPDGTRLTVASVEPVFGISIAENVPRVHRPR
jgi:Tol biopolymer transport system component